MRLPASEKLEIIGEKVRRAPRSSGISPAANRQAGRRSKGRSLMVASQSAFHRSFCVPLDTLVFPHTASTTASSSPLGSKPVSVTV